MFYAHAHAHTMDAPFLAVERGWGRGFVHASLELRAMCETCARCAVRGQEEVRRMNLTEEIQKAIEAQIDRREPTAAEKKAVADFVADCRRANPYTRRFFNCTKQIQLAMVAVGTAAELKDAAKYEGVDERKANPGLADEKGDGK